jgi:hypothetical protein
MRTFTIECVELEGVCELNKLDYHDVSDMISDSYISFGMNADTLLTRAQLEHIIKQKLLWEGSEDILISLGC